MRGGARQLLGRRGEAGVCVRIAESLTARVRFSQVRVVQEILQVVQLTYLEVLLRLLQRNLLVLLILLLRLKLKLVIHPPKVLVPPAALLYDKVFRLSVCGVNCCGAHRS